MKAVKSLLVERIVEYACTFAFCTAVALNARQEGAGTITTMFAITGALFSFLIAREVLKYLVKGKS